MECDIIVGIYGEPRGGNRRTNRLENNAGLIRAPRAPRRGGWTRAVYKASMATRRTMAGGSGRVAAASDEK